MSIVDDFRAIADRLRAIEGGYACDCGRDGAHAHDCAIFRCSVCRIPCDVAPDDGPAFCPDHCPDHDYQYEDMTRRWECATCGDVRTDPYD